jgi:hypothetical protein
MQLVSSRPLEVRYEHHTAYCRPIIVSTPRAEADGGGVKLVMSVRFELYYDDQLPCDPVEKGEIDAGTLDDPRFGLPHAVARLTDVMVTLQLDSICKSAVMIQRAYRQRLARRREPLPCA